MGPLTPRRFSGRPKGPVPPVELLWKLRQVTAERRATLVRSGREFELHLTLNGARYFTRRYPTRKAALQDARSEREKLERKGWEPAQ